MVGLMPLKKIYQRTCLSSLSKCTKKGEVRPEGEGGCLQPKESALIRQQP